MESLFFRLGERYLRFVDPLTVWTGRIGASLIFVIIALQAREIIGRYFFHSSTIWVAETVIYMWVFMIALAVALTLLNEEHIRIDLLYSRFSQRTRCILDWLTFPCILFFCGIVLWKGAAVAIDSFRIWEVTGSAWHPLVWPARFAVPISFSLLLLQVFAKYIRNISILRRGTDFKEFIRGVDYKT